MKKKMRVVIQIICFLFFVYGGYVGLRCTNFMPVLSCPNSVKHAGGCYLLPLQRVQYGVDAQVPHGRGVVFSGYFNLYKWHGYAILVLTFVLAVLVLRRAWCRYMCPFGTVQDGIAMLREEPSVPHARVAKIGAWIGRRKKVVQWIVVFLFVIFPLLYPFGFREEIEPLFCQICPVKVLMLLCNGNTLNLAVHTSDSVLPIENIVGFIIPSVVTLVGAGGMLVLLYFQKRFFCLVCPVGALFDFILVRRKKSKGQTRAFRAGQRDSLK